MTGWRRDEVFRRVARNTGRLFSGKVAGAVLHFASIALTARLLDTAAFGLLMLFRSYAQGAAALARFQSWQALVHFGSSERTPDRAADLRNLVGFTILLDAGVGLIALVLAMGLGPEIGPLIGIPADHIGLALVYCLAIPFLVSGTPTGVLRIFDRFDIMAWQSLITPATRLTGLIIVWALGASLQSVVLCWLISDVAGELFMWLTAWREGRRQGLTHGLYAPLQALRKHPGIWRYLLATSGNASLQQGAVPVLTLLVGNLVGAAGAGAYRLAQTILEAVAIPAELAMRSFFPEVARLRADKADMGRILKRFGVGSFIAAIPLTLGLAIAAPWLVKIVTGDEFGAAGSLLRILSLSIIPVFVASVLETIVLASGDAALALASRVVATLVTVTLIFLLEADYGLEGIGISVVIGSATSAILLLIAAVRRVRIERRDRHVG